MIMSEQCFHRFLGVGEDANPSAFSVFDRLLVDLKRGFTGWLQIFLNLAGI